MMLPRSTEPELMEDATQAAAYANADFSASHEALVAALAERFSGGPGRHVIDLGCGPADFAIRVVRAWPDCCIDGVDGSTAMLAEGRRRLEHEGLTERIRLHPACLPADPLPAPPYDAVISNSLLHHLHAPEGLWDTVRRAGRPGSRVFVGDLMRPGDAATAQAIVDRMAGNEPDILRRDFLASLHAAFTVDEVRAQIERADLDLAVAALDDHHLVIWGEIPA